MKGYDLKVAKLTKKQRDIILKHLPIRTQSARIFEYLSQYDHVKTGELCAKTSTVNLSHVTQVELNPRLKKFGLVVGCERPEYPHRNQFDQTTAEHDWSLYELDETELNWAIAK
jgi:hypothetical protein